MIGRVIALVCLALAAFAVGALAAGRVLIELAP